MIFKTCVVCAGAAFIAKGFSVEIFLFAASKITKVSTYSLLEIKK
ncbi:hypothetical protein PI23P_06495 [Polaribacter irgensii 23-P]|uniref:Uncharacterized protein n=1 Tax=Polaribacter irgensii 23-P TaxID=313594 RepID=A4BYK8_9FLAO|nr:hypothetical protein PI23P_06495 [Polaribacter irgensii 23-P]